MSETEEVRWAKNMEIKKFKSDQRVIEFVPLEYQNVSIIKTIIIRIIAKVITEQKKGKIEKKRRCKFEDYETPCLSTEQSNKALLKKGKFKVSYIW